MYMYIHVHDGMYLYVHGIDTSVPYSDIYLPFCPILSRWVGFQMAGQQHWPREVTVRWWRRSPGCFEPAGQRGSCWDWRHSSGRLYNGPVKVFWIGSRSSRYSVSVEQERVGKTNIPALEASWRC